MMPQPTTTTNRLRSLHASHETMTAFLSHLEVVYGGVEAYVNRYLGLSDEDIRTIRHNILDGP